MFVFERYFIFALSFVLLILAQGIVGLAEYCKGIYKNGFILFSFLVIIYVQFPTLNKMLTQDRQNYREAMKYVVSEIQEGMGDLVFSIGYAGEHFHYYASGMTILTPETFDELSGLIQGKEHIWCVITAWLPDIRPPYEDEALYAERFGQIEIYNYVKKHFMLKKAFASKYPVKIYYLQR